MSRLTQHIIITLIIVLIDVLWITLVMKKHYSTQIRNIQGGKDMKTNVVYAILAYIFLLSGIYHFVLPNISETNRIYDSIKYGFVYGIIVYSVYDFTSAAVFDKWNIKLALVDILWGGIIAMFSCYVLSLIK